MKGGEYECQVTRENYWNPIKHFWLSLKGDDRPYDSICHSNLGYYYFL